MLASYDLDGQAVDALDLKCLLIGTGMRYPARVHAAVAGRARLEPPTNPHACNCIILPGQVAVHLTVNETSPLALDLDDDGRVCLFHEGRRLTEVSLPPATKYYDQRAGAGRPFGAFAVLEGAGVLAFFYLWPCEYVRTRETCEFCFQVRAEMTGFKLPSPSNEEVAEIIDWGIEHAGVQEVQLTAGTKFTARDECRRYAQLLEAIDRRVGLDRIPGEICCYATAPDDPAAADQILEAGAGPHRPRPARLGPRDPCPRCPRARPARRPRGPASGPGARRRQVRPEPRGRALSWPGSSRWIRCSRAPSISPRGASFRC